MKKAIATITTALMVSTLTPVVSTTTTTQPLRNPFIPMSAQRSAVGPPHTHTLRNHLSCHESTHAVVVMHYARLTEKLKLIILKLWDSLIENDRTKEGTYCIIDETSRTLFCNASPATISRFEHYIRAIDVKASQVHIEARIVIANKHFEENFGVRWSGCYNQSSTADVSSKKIHLGQAEQTTDDHTTLHKVLDWVINTFPTPWEKRRTFCLPIVLGSSHAHANKLTLLLNAAEHNHEIKTILKPSIVAQDKETAEILEGEVIPIESNVEESHEGRLRNVHTASYKDVGIQLRVKPYISRLKEMVTLDLFVENSMVDEKTSAHTNGPHKPSYPTIITTRSKTRVMLKSGQTTMISGLIKNRHHQEKSALPFLSKIPLIGSLFKGEQTSTHNLQLLVFITATILD